MEKNNFICFSTVTGYINFVPKNAYIQWVFELLNPTHSAYANGIHKGVRVQLHFYHDDTVSDREKEETK